MSISIREFDPTTISDGAIVGVVGRRGSGKSVIIKDLLYYKRHKLPCGLVMSGTEAGNGYFSKFIPDIFVFDDFDGPALEKLVERQKLAAKKGNLGKVFVVLDDLAFDSSIMKKPVMRFIFMNGRHLNIFLIFSSQYVSDLGPPAIRANIDVLFVCREAIQANRFRLYNMFFGVFESFEDFNKVLNACTENYGVLVLDNTKLSNDPTACVFHHKAKMRDDFRMGSYSFWKFSKTRVKKDKDEGDDHDGVKLIKGKK
jgi:energy-coupling factor transporter ATP-binding protein EcfA2